MSRAAGTRKHPLLLLVHSTLVGGGSRWSQIHGSGTEAKYVLYL